MGELVEGMEVSSGCLAVVYLILFLPGHGSLCVPYLITSESIWGYCHLFHLGSPFLRSWRGMCSPDQI